MKRIMAILVIVALITCLTGCSLVGGGKSNLPNDGPALTGRVVIPTSSITKSLVSTNDGYEESPVRGATISIDVDGKTMTAKTDANGYFSISGLSPLRKYVINAILPKGYALPQLRSFGAPGNEPEPTEVSVATTAAVESMQTLSFRSEHDIEFDKLVSAAKESASVRDIIDHIRRGDAVSLDEIGGASDEVIDNFFLYYYPLNIRHTFTYRTTVYSGNWEPEEEPVSLQLEGTGEEQTIYVAGEPRRATKWIQWDEGRERITWMSIQNGTMCWYDSHGDDETTADLGLSYSLKGKDLTTLELEDITTEAGTFHALKITAEVKTPYFTEHGTWWLSPGIGMVSYRGEQPIGFKYTTELVDY